MTASALRTAAIGAPAPNPVVAFSSFLDKFKPQLALALPKHLNSDRMARLALSEFSKTPKLQQCDAKTIAASIMTAGTLGLEIGVNGAGFLVPYGRTCTFVPGWKGLQDLANRSGRSSTWTGAVFEGDEFDYQLGDKPFVHHRPGDEDDPRKLTHVYAVGRVKGADWPIIEVWKISKVWKHRDKYNKVGQQHYSFRDPEMYARKVPLLQVLKYVPSSVELSNAIAIADAGEMGRSAYLGGDFGDMVTVGDLDPDTGEVTPPTPPASTPAATTSSAPRPAAKRATGKGVADTPAPSSSPAAADTVDRKPLTEDALQAWVRDVTKGPRTRDDADAALDLARSELTADDFAVVTKAFHERWGE